MWQEKLKFLRHQLQKGKFQSTNYNSHLGLLPKVTLYITATSTVSFYLPGALTQYQLVKTNSLQHPQVPQLATHRPIWVAFPYHILVRRRKNSAQIYWIMRTQWHTTNPSNSVLAHLIWIQISDPPNPVLSPLCGSGCSMYFPPKFCYPGSF